jgi:membrane associated rhomboid family serine protease
MNRATSAISIIIVVCVIFFALSFVSNEIMYETFALYFPRNENFRIWQFVSNIFMHGGFAHIFFNMYALWAFGSPLEQMWGKKKFTLFFFLAGIGAAVIYTLVNYFKFESLYNDLISSGLTPDEILAAINTPMRNVLDGSLQELKEIYRIPVVGASGAIYGVLVAFGILFPNAKLFLIFLPIPIAAKYFIPALICLDLFSGVTGVSIFGGGIAHFGHVGGAIIGFLLMLYWRQKQKPRYPRYGDQHYR